MVSGLTRRPTGYSAQSQGCRKRTWQPRVPAQTRIPATCRDLPGVAQERAPSFPSLAHLEHKPDEDAEHQAEADVRVVVDDELLAEERVTFRPPAESHGSGRAAAGRARTLRSGAAAQTSPAPARSARRPAALPPAGQAPKNFWGPPPSSVRPRPRRPEPPPAAAPSSAAARTPRAERSAPPPARLTLAPPGSLRGWGECARPRCPSRRAPLAARPRRARPHSGYCGPDASRAGQAGRGVVDAGPALPGQEVGPGFPLLGARFFLRGKGRAGEAAGPPRGGQAAGYSRGCRLWPWGAESRPSSVMEGKQQAGLLAVRSALHG